jgi:uncharacterized surface protein with fasciclin (FAS1) repeats
MTALIVESIIENTTSLSTFNSLFMQKTFPNFYSLFVPDDSSFDVLHRVELSYLKTRFGEEDRSALLFRHASRNITYGQDLKQGSKIPSLQGEDIHCTLRDHDILVDGANVTQRDIVARNGILSQYPLI